MGLALFFYDTLVAWAGGTDLIYYIIFGLTELISCWMLVITWC